MQYLRGSDLTPEDQKRVKTAFVHRYTKEHIPDWATPSPGRKTYNVQFESDADWLANSFFPCTNTGRWASHSSFCESHPTWPNNPELRKYIGTTLDKKQTVCVL